MFVVALVLALCVGSGVGEVEVMMPLGVNMTLGSWQSCNSCRQYGPTGKCCCTHVQNDTSPVCAGTGPLVYCAVEQQIAYLDCCGCNEGGCYVCSKGLCRPEGGCYSASPAGKIQWAPALLLLAVLALPWN
eukprot:TRINITY_DN10608_c0_g1_i1.p1 TRINITY_DN10608_c0_g1~~TRINITY_DN10608_c0_g1_i1.p1  ORF type:complete len:131 (+),score=2.64 TRINITY_DN10608_c0_g1_i1:39-431(+)